MHSRWFRAGRPVSCNARHETTDCAGRVSVERRVMVARQRADCITLEFSLYSYNVKSIGGNHAIV